MIFQLPWIPGTVSASVMRSGKFVASLRSQNGRFVLAEDFIHYFPGKFLVISCFLTFFSDYPHTSRTWSSWSSDSRFFFYLKDNVDARVVVRQFCSITYLCVVSRCQVVMPWWH